MATALGFGKILELGAGMTEHAIIDELHVSRLEVEVGRQFLVLEQVEQRGERGGAFVVELLAPQRVAAADLVRAEAGPHLPAIGEHWRREDRWLAGMELTLPVEPERLVKPRQ